MPAPQAAPAPGLPAWLSPRACVLAGGLLGGVALLIGVWFLHFQSNDMDAQALQEAELYARVLTDHTDRTVDAAVLAMRAAAESSRSLALAEIDRLDGSLAAAARSLPFIRSLSLLDAGGAVLASSNIANRAAQIRFADMGLPLRAGRVLVGRVQSGRDLIDQAVGSGRAGAAQTRNFVPVALVIDGAQGGAALIVVAVLNADYLATGFELLLSGTPYAAALLQMDGTALLSAQPLMLDPSTPRLTGSPIFKRFLPQHEQGRFIGAGLDASKVVSAFRVTRQAPWLLAVQQPYALLQDGFLRLAGQVFALLLLAWLGIALLCFFGVRSLRAYGAAQAQRQQAHRQLQDQLALIGGLMDASPVPLFVKDDQGLLLMANQAWCDFTGLRPGDWIGRALSEQHPDFDPQDAGRSDEMLLKDGGRVSFEVAMRGGPDRGARDVLVSKADFSDGSGRIAGLVCSLADVSVYREAERRSREARLAAEQISLAKTEFVANVSHEMRTPLQTIIGFSELGASRYRDPPKLQQMFERIHAAGVHMLGLVNDVLALSGRDSAEAGLEIRLQPVIPLIDAALHALGDAAAERGVGLVLTPPAEALSLAVDAGAFLRVLRLVLENAVRHAPSGSRVEIEWQAEATGGVLRVLDRGPGIPEAELEAIFEPFVQSSRTKDGSGGTGLGLSISRRLLAAMGASISAHNRAGGGAVFMLHFAR